MRYIVLYLCMFCFAIHFFIVIGIVMINSISTILVLEVPVPYVYVITVPLYALAPNSDMTPADTMLTTKLDMFSFKIFCRSNMPCYLCGRVTSFKIAEGICRFLAAFWMLNAFRHKPTRFIVSDADFLRSVQHI